jgi:hypothetical protein
MGQLNMSPASRVMALGPPNNASSLDIDLPPRVDTG